MGKELAFTPIPALSRSRNFVVEVKLSVTYYEQILLINTKKRTSKHSKLVSGNEAKYVTVAKIHGESYLYFENARQEQFLKFELGHTDKYILIVWT